MITIRFVTQRDAASEGTRAFEYGYWATHAEALMPDGALLGAHALGGVEARPRDYDSGRITREEYVPIEASPEMADSFHGFLRAQIGKPYDFDAIAAFVAGGVIGERNWRRPDSWFCSELIAASLCHCGFFPERLATEFNHITPRDLLLILSGRVRIAA